MKTVNLTSFKDSWQEKWNYLKCSVNCSLSSTDIVQTCCNALCEKTLMETVVFGINLNWLNSEVNHCISLISNTLKNKKFQNVIDASEITERCGILVKECNDNKELCEKLLTLLNFVGFLWISSQEVEVNTLNDIITTQKEFYKFSHNLPYYDGYSNTEILRLWSDPSFYCSTIPETFFSIYNSEICGKLLYSVAYSLHQENRLDTYAERLQGLCERFLEHDKQHHTLILNLIASSFAKKNDYKIATSLIKKLLSTKKPQFSTVLIFNLCVLYRLNSSSNQKTNFKVWKSLHRQCMSKLNMSNVTINELFFVKTNNSLEIQHSFDYSQLFDNSQVLFYCAVFSALGRDFQQAYKFCKQIIDLESMKSKVVLPFELNLNTPSIAQVITLMTYCSFVTFEAKPDLLEFSSNLDLQSSASVYMNESYSFEKSSYDQNNFENYFKSAEQLHFCICLKLYEIKSKIDSESVSSLKESIMECIVKLNDINSNPIKMCDHSEFQNGCLSCLKHFYDILLSKDKSKLLFNYALVCCKDNSSSNSLKKNDIVMALHKSMQHDVTNLQLRWNCVVVLFELGMAKEAVKLWCKTRSIEFASSSDDIDCEILIRSEEMPNATAGKKELINKDIAILREMYKFC